VDISKGYIIGVDVGGTDVKVSLNDLKGNFIAKTSLPTYVPKGEEVVLHQIISAIEEVIKLGEVTKGEIIGIGVGAPGPLNTKEGIIYHAPNLNWRNLPLKKIIEEGTGIRTWLDNDANLAALGEKVFGVGKDSQNMILLTLGTGIGGGIIIDGKLYRGSDDGAGEVGHMTIEPNGYRCNCGNRGCMEALASAPNMVRRTKEALSAGEESIIPELVGGDLDKIDTKVLATAARKGDKLAEKIWKKTGEYLGIGIGNLINVLSPDMIVLGGGVSHAGDLLLEPIRETLKERAMQANPAMIVLAELGNDAGVLGAVALVIQNLNLV